MKHPSFQQYSHDVGTAVHDTWITTKVKSALTMSEPTRGLHISVTTHAGRVTLSGRVNSHKQCEQAIARARSVQGVLDVDASDLQIHMFTPGSFPEAPNAEESTDYSPSKKDDSK
ncbi:Osmotically-inducible protein Y precursor [compost metagenome]